MSRSGNSNQDKDFIIAQLRKVVENNEKQLKEQSQLIASLQELIKSLQNSFDAFRADIANNQNRPQQQNQPQQRAAINENRPRDDRSAVNNPSYAAITQRRGLYRNIPEHPVSQRHKNMAECNKAFNNEYNTVAEFVQAIKPAGRAPSASACRPIYIKLAFSRLAQEGKFRIIKNISQKATGRHPYNIRAVFNNIYELAYDAEDAAHCKEQFKNSGIEVMDSVDIFASPPTQPDKPIEQTKKQVANSMGFALGRAYHPAVANMYRDILHLAGHPDVYEQVDIYSRNTRNKYIRIAKGVQQNGKRQQQRQTTIRTATPAPAANAPTTADQGNLSTQHQNNTTQNPDATEHNDDFDADMDG